MLFNFYRKSLNVIKQWFEITGTIINPCHHPVKIRIKELDSRQQYFVQRNRSALKNRR